MSYDVEFCVCWFSIKVLGFTVTVCGVSAHMKNKSVSRISFTPLLVQKRDERFSAFGLC